MISSVETFRTVNLEDIKTVSLMKRDVSKYLLKKETLKKIICSMSNDYKTLEVDGQKIIDYSTTYYDTEKKEMYHDHHNKKLERYKIRVRTYINSGISYLEIKRKGNNGQTIKNRVNVPSDKSATSDFINIHTPYSFKDLEKQFTIDFSRITLINLEEKERITIDTDLKFYNDIKEIYLDGLSIIEIKKERKAFKSRINQLLKSNGVHKYSCSKYCVGQVLLNEKSVRYNRFKKKINKIKKVSQFKEHKIGEF